MDIESETQEYYEYRTFDGKKWSGWRTAIPAPYYHSFFPWLWRRLTGYRDEYGRKAVLWKPWEL